MAYKIAVGSSDGVKIDESFGSAKRFLIYEADGDVWRLIGERAVPGVNGALVDPALAKAIGEKNAQSEEPLTAADDAAVPAAAADDAEVPAAAADDTAAPVAAADDTAAGGVAPDAKDCGTDRTSCGTGGGCTTGIGAADCGSGGGCHGAPFAKVGLIDDCRAIVCSKIGFNVQKQLEKKAISYFDVSCPIEEALKKITYYYNRLDRHESLRPQP